MKTKQLSIVAAICFAFAGMAYAQDAASNSTFEQVNDLQWVEGPTEVTVGGNATFQIPTGYRYLGPAGTVKFMELTKNLPPDDGETIFAPDDFRWFAALDYRDVGHVPDNDKIDPTSLLDTLRQNQTEANKQLEAKGWPTLEIVGWRFQPFYDPDTHNLSWAFDGRSSNGDDIVNYNTRLLGRTGYTAATLVADPAELQKAVTEFKTTVVGYKFIPEQTYSAYKPGDKVAKYGLAALVTGGAAAVAVKTGLWKVVVGALVAGWKIVAAAVVALLAGLGRLLKGKFGNK